jgi:Holliday junction DNA helicase RuvB
MRDGFRCVICDDKRKLCVHHLKSRANGGLTRQEFLASCCLNCHSFLHGELMKLRWDKENGLIPLDSEGNPIGKEGGMAGALKDSKLPVAVIKVQPAAEEETEANNADASALPSIRSIDDVPAELSPAGTHALSSVLDWNAAQRLFVIRPDWTALPGVPAASTDEAVEKEEVEKKQEEEEPADPAEGFPRVIGQSTVVANLREAVQAARIRGVPLDHVLLEGPPGLGKTTLAQVLAVEMRSRLHAITAPSIEHPHHLVMLLAGLNAGDIFFIDEIHRLDKRCEECLYSALEYGYIDLLLGGEGRRRTVRAFLNPFTLVGATTELGSLAKPFRDRFTLREELTYYSVDELVTVVEQQARRFGSPISRDAARAIAGMARGTPREAIQLLKRVRNVAVTDGCSEIGVRHIRFLADRIGIDENGLGPRDRAVLEFLIARNRPIGLKTIALTLGLDAVTLEQVCEPYLVYQRYVIRTHRGRRATTKAHREYSPGGYQARRRTPPTSQERTRTATGR